MVTGQIVDQPQRIGSNKSVQTPWGMAMVPDPLYGHWSSIEFYE